MARGRVYNEFGYDVTPLSWGDRRRLGLRMLRWKIRNNRRVVLLLAKLNTSSCKEREEGG